MLTESKQGSLTATATGVTVNGTNAESFAVQLTGTFVATVTFQASLDGGTTWVAIGMTPVADPRAGAITTTAAAAGIWVLPVQCAAISQFRAQCTAFTSGTIVVTVTAGA